MSCHQTRIKYLVFYNSILVLGGVRGGFRERASRCSRLNVEMLDAVLLLLTAFFWSIFLRETSHNAARQACSLLLCPGICPILRKQCIVQQHSVFRDERTVRSACALGSRLVVYVGCRFYEM